MILRPEPLTRQAFSLFGEVLEMEGASPISINQGYARRFADLAKIDTAAEAGTTAIGIVEAMPRPWPLRVDLMERHPLGSQIFFPLHDRNWLVLVAQDPRDPATYRAYRATGRQGVNYARNVWHHPLLVLEPQSLFLVIDRKGPGSNLEEFHLPTDNQVTLSP